MAVALKKILINICQELNGSYLSVTLSKTENRKYFSSILKNLGLDLKYDGNIQLMKRKGID